MGERQGRNKKRLLVTNATAPPGTSLGVRGWPHTEKSRCGRQTTKKKLGWVNPQKRRKGPGLGGGGKTQMKTTPQKNRVGGTQTTGERGKNKKNKRTKMNQVEGGGCWVRWGKKNLQHKKKHRRFNKGGVPSGWGGVVG